MLVKKFCVFCSQPSEVEVDEATYKEYIKGKILRLPASTHSVQVLFPNLTPAEREVLISGSHDECFECFNKGMTTYD